MGRALDKAKWGPVRSAAPDSFNRLLAEHNAFTELERHPAWGAYQDRISNLLKTMRQQLELGTVDKFGLNHDEEKRAVIHVLESILSYPPALHAEFQRQLEHKQKEEAKRADFGPIHGPDLPGPSLDEFLRS